MSYILDALKKSEQERGHGNIPDVQTVHSSSLNYRNEKKAYWPYILITAVVLNLLAIIYFIVDKESPTDIAGTAPQTNAVIQTTLNSNTSPAIILQTEKPATVAISDNNRTEAPARENPITEATASEKIKPAATDKVETIDTKNDEPPLNRETKILEFYELPESIKQDLPSFVISAHVYSSNPLQRSIVINNNFLEEGEYVLDGLILYEITPDGAIFNYQGTLFSYGVVSGWQ